MKSKREVLKTIAKYGCCYELKCSECPYDIYDICSTKQLFTRRLASIGAMAILRQNRNNKNKKREFDPSKILTCVTFDKAKVGMKGYFGDSIAYLRSEFEKGDQASELTEILDESCWGRFRNSNCIAYGLFYPIDDDKVEPLINDKVELTPRKFDTSKILTAVTADKAKVGMKGYFGDDLTGLKTNFEKKIIYELSGVYEENCTYRFDTIHNMEYALFYPIDEEVTDEK